MSWGGGVWGGALLDREGPDPFGVQHVKHGVGRFKIKDGLGLEI